MARDGRLFRSSGGEWCIFDAAAAQVVERQNFHDIPLPGGTDRRDVRWAELRAALIGVSARQNCPGTLSQLAGRMREGLDVCLRGAGDLTLPIVKAVSGALVPLVIDGMDSATAKAVDRDQARKLENLLTPAAVRHRRRDRMRDAWIQAAAGRAVKRHLAARRSGSLPARLDSVQAIVEFGDRLSSHQASYVLMSVMTAISGAPGSVGACLAYRLELSPDWKARITEELKRAGFEALCEAPAKVAPDTYRFLREILRLYSFPMVSHRRATRDLKLEPAYVAEDEFYHLSSFFTHRDPEHWADAEAFDPNRWAKGCPAPARGAYVPFGWAERTCTGAAIGTSQLALLAWLLTQEFRIEVSDDARPWWREEGFLIPADFRGRLKRF